MASKYRNVPPMDYSARLAPVTELPKYIQGADNASLVKVLRVLGLTFSGNPTGGNEAPSAPPPPEQQPSSAGTSRRNSTARKRLFNMGYVTRSLTLFEGPAKQPPARPTTPRQREALPPVPLAVAGAAANEPGVGSANGAAATNGRPDARPKSGDGRLRSMAKKLKRHTAALVSAGQGKPPSGRPWSAVLTTTETGWQIGFPGESSPLSEIGSASPRLQGEGGLHSASPGWLAGPASAAAPARTPSGDSKFFRSVWKRKSAAPSLGTATATTPTLLVTPPRHSSIGDGDGAARGSASAPIRTPSPRKQDATRRRATLMPTIAEAPLLRGLRAKLGHPPRDRRMSSSSVYLAATQRWEELPRRLSSPTTEREKRQAQEGVARRYEPAADPFVHRTTGPGRTTSLYAASVNVSPATPTSAPLRQSSIVPHLSQPIPHRTPQSPWAPRNSQPNALEVTLPPYPKLSPHKNPSASLTPGRNSQADVQGPASDGGLREPGQVGPDSSPRKSLSPCDTSVLLEQLSLLERNIVVVDDDDRERAATDLLEQQLAQLQAAVDTSSQSSPSGSPRVEPTRGLPAVGETDDEAVADDDGGEVGESALPDSYVHSNGLPNHNSTADVATADGDETASLETGSPVFQALSSPGAVLPEGEQLSLNERRTSESSLCFSDESTTYLAVLNILEDFDTTERGRDQPVENGVAPVEVLQTPKQASFGTTAASVSTRSPSLRSSQSDSFDSVFEVYQEDIFKEDRPTNEGLSDLPVPVANGSGYTEVPVSTPSDFSEGERAVSRRAITETTDVSEMDRTVSGRATGEMTDAPAATVERTSREWSKPDSPVIRPVADDFPEPPGGDACPAPRADVDGKPRRSLAKEKGDGPPAPPRGATAATAGALRSVRGPALPAAAERGYARGASGGVAVARAPGLPAAMAEILPAGVVLIPGAETLSGLAAMTREELIGHVNDLTRELAWAESCVTARDREVGRLWQEVDRLRREIEKLLITSTSP